MELNDQIYAKITELSEQGNDAIEINDFQGARSLFESALALLPHPQMRWEAYTWLHASIGDTYFNQMNYASALDSFVLAASGEDGLENPFILLRLGQSYFEMHQLEQAEEYLLRAYMLEGAEIYESEDPKYLNYMQAKYALEE